jgi:hypothetical protein
MENWASGVSIATILGAPILSNYGFRFGFVENILVRLFLVGIIIYIIQKDVFLGLIAFLAVFTLLLERNHALALDLPNQRINVTVSPPLLPSKATAIVETKVNFEEENKDIQDNIPRLEPAPTSGGAAAFFKTL